MLRIRTLMLVCLFSLVGAGCGFGGFTMGGGGGGGGGPWPQAAPTFHVLSRNVYYGADLSPALGAMLAGDVDAILASVAGVHAQLLATDFPARARGLAEEFVETDFGRGPAVVGLQEVGLWRRQVPSDTFSAPTGAEDVLLDLLEVLLDALEAEGLAYDVVAVQEGFDGELPYLDAADGLVDLRITDRDVLLVRRDLARRGAFHGNFAARVVLPGLEIPTSYVGCYVQIHGTWVRFVSAHLEADDPDVRRAQVRELLDGPCDADGPTVLLGDLNAESGLAGNDGSLDALFDEGFDDAWYAFLHGPTATLDAGLSDPDAVATERVDYVLTRTVPGTRPIGSYDAQVTGLALEDRVVASDGRLLWRSDHGGVLARLWLE